MGFTLQLGPQAEQLAKGAVQYPGVSRKQILPLTDRPAAQARPMGQVRVAGSWQRGTIESEECARRASSLCPLADLAPQRRASACNGVSGQCTSAAAEGAGRLRTALKRRQRKRSHPRRLESTESLFGSASRRRHGGGHTRLQCRRDCPTQPAHGRCETSVQGHGEPAASSTRRQDTRRQCLGDFLADVDSDGLPDDRDGEGLEDARSSSSGSKTDLEFGGPSRETNGAATQSNRISEGGMLSLGLGVALLVALLAVDAVVWRLIRRPLAAFLLTIPFVFSAAITAALGSVAVPLLGQLKARQITRAEGPASHAVKAGTPTMGGIYFVPTGVLVAWAASGAPPEVVGAAAATLLFMALGALDDGLMLLRKHNYGLPGRIKFLIQTAAGVGFFFWLKNAPISHPYVWKLIVPLPLPLGLWYMGQLYLPLTAFTFAAMSNAVNLTDGLDGLAAGTCAAALTAMAVAVLPMYPALSIFGAAMAGSCVGFLAHNSNPARVFMGDTGSLALGAALAAMAAASGLFLPLLIASLVFAAEALSVMIQVAVFQVTKHITGTGHRVFRMSPFHHHLELSGWSETSVVAAAYVSSLCLAAVAAYVALVSV